MIEGLEGLPAAEEQLALYEALEEASKTDEEVEDEDEDVLIFKDIEALKAHIFTLSDNHMLRPHQAPRLQPRRKCLPAGRNHQWQRRRRSCPWPNLLTRPLRTRPRRNPPRSRKPGPRSLTMPRSKVPQTFTATIPAWPNLRTSFFPCRKKPTPQRRATMPISL